MWRASHLLIHANVVSKWSLTSVVSIYNAFGLHTVSFRMTFSFIIPSACGASPQNFIPPSVIWTRIEGPLDPVTYLSWPISFILIGCPLLHIFVVFYIDGLWSIFLLMVMFFLSRQENYLCGIPWAAAHLLLWTCGGFPLALLLTRASLRLLRPFIPYIMGALLLISPISFLLIFEKETVALNFVRLFHNSVT